MSDVRDADVLCRIVSCERHSRVAVCTCDGKGRRTVFSHKLVHVDPMAESHMMICVEVILFANEILSHVSPDLTM